jgi:hypothetical protein
VDLVESNASCRACCRNKKPSAKHPHIWRQIHRARDGSRVAMRDRIHMNTVAYSYSSNIRARGVSNHLPL